MLEVGVKVCRNRAENATKNYHTYMHHLLVCVYSSSAPDSTENSRDAHVFNKRQIRTQFNEVLLELLDIVGLSQKRR